MRLGRGSASWLMATVALVPTSRAMAQEQTAIQAAADERAAQASIAEANARIAAANAAILQTQLSPLASLAGSGTREVKDGAGRIEVALLGSASLVNLAGKIAADVGDGKAVVLADDETVNFAAGWQFDAERQQIIRRLKRVSDAGPKVCIPAAEGSATTQVPGHKASFALPAAGVFAALGAVGSLLKSDVTVAGITYAPKSRIVATLVARRLGSGSVTPGMLLAPDLTSVQNDFTALEDVEDKANHVAAACLKIAEAKQTPSQTALVTEYGAATAALTTLRTRVYTPDASGRVALLDILVARSVKQARVLRIRVEDSGGSVITTKNLLTAFGAPALNLTAGVMASYVLFDPTSGAVAGTALYRCRSTARMLRSVHRPKDPDPVCETVPEATAPEPNPPR